MQRTVGAVCIREVVVAEATDSVLELARLMRQHHVGDIVITQRRGDKRYPIGLVTDRDIVIEALVDSLEGIHDLMANDLLNRPVVIAREQDTLDDAIEIMRRNGVRRVPVVDDEGALIGILAVDDVIEVLADRLSELVVLFSRGRRLEADLRP